MIASKEVRLAHSKLESTLYLHQGWAKTGADNSLWLNFSLKQFCGPIFSKPNQKKIVRIRAYSLKISVVGILI